MLQYDCGFVCTFTWSILCFIYLRPCFLVPTNLELQNVSAESILVNENFFSTLFVYLFSEINIGIFLWLEFK